MPNEMKSKQALRVCGIRRSFKGKDGVPVQAVDGISLNIYENQITAILGHNGAGKTTLINMLTGLLPPTSGTATIFGLDVTVPSDLAELRRMTGVCPQDDILMDLLSCREHLELYAAIKGVDTRSSAEEALQQVALGDQAETLAEKLSGGQKRRLCVAMALIGDPRVLFLDEPSAGLDPQSRRTLWTLLQSKREGRVIVLTTHFMDEADILADRKAVVSRGQLRCVGSSLFLKNRFGLGYHLHLVSRGEEPRVTSVVQTCVPGAQLSRVHGMELSYTLPLSQIDQFAALFAQLEGPSASPLGIEDVGVSMTSLEEVFLRLADESTEAVTRVDSNGYGSMGDPAAYLDPAVISAQMVTARALDKQRFVAMVRFRFLLAVRSKIVIFFRFVLSPMLVIVSLVVQSLVQTRTPELPVIAMAPTLYQNALLVLNATASSLQPLASAVQNVTGAKLTIADDPFNLTRASSVFNGFRVYGNPLQYAFTLLYNYTAVYAPPCTLNAISNAMLQLAGSSARIQVDSQPLPQLDTSTGFSGSFGSIMILGYAVLVIPSGLSVDKVRERQDKIRNQLRLSGVTTNMYWLTFFISDFAFVLIPGVIIIIAIFAIGVEFLKPAPCIVAFVIIYLLYSVTTVLLSYCISFAFKAYETCQNVAPLALIMLGLLPYIATSLTYMTGSVSAGRTMHIVFSFLLPPYTFFGAMFMLESNYRSTLYKGGVTFANVFSFDSYVPYTFLGCLLWLLVFPFLLRLLEVHSTGGKLKDACSLRDPERAVSVTASSSATDVVLGDDSDVAQERIRVRGLLAAAATAPQLLIQRLRKEYTKRTKSSSLRHCLKNNEDKIEAGVVKVAVSDLTLGFEPGEVFGLLGPNGAGKTTTVSMLIGQEGATSGRVSVNGIELTSSISKACQLLGYCPQRDALWDIITLREHLHVHASLRGVRREHVDTIARYFIDGLKVNEHADKRAKTLSGGTKRKLSFALSMLGNPKYVLLDEPSTGMDPASKRFLWDTISASFSQSERGAVLTTHSMEEADALCDRIGIMVDGSLRCLGSSQHLKSKFGSGYVLEVKLIASRPVDNSLHDFVHSLFPQATPAEQFGQRVTYRVPREDVQSLCTVFRGVQESKERLGIEEYSFSQSTLEQVFLEFAKQQSEERSDV